MAVLQTYQVTTNQDDLTDIITNITPDETPLLSNAPSTKAYMTYHEWQKDNLSTPTANSNAQIEGADFASQAQHAPTRDGSYAQLFLKWPHVSETQIAVRNVGIKNLYDYNVTQQLKDIALDIEYALINATGNSGASGTAREIKGVLSAISTNIKSGATGLSTLTEEMYNTLLKQIYDAGGKPNVTYTTSTLKQVISGFTGGSTKNVDATSKKLIASVDVYESDYGVQKIIIHRMMAANTLAALQMDKWRVAWLRKTKHEPLAKTGDSVKGKIAAECALEAMNEAASGKYINLTT